MAVRIRQTDFFATKSKITDEGDLIEITFTCDHFGSGETLSLQMTRDTYARLIRDIFVGATRTRH